MKRFFALLLLLATALPLFSCATEPATTETQDNTAPTTAENQTAENKTTEEKPQEPQYEKAPAPTPLAGVQINGTASDYTKLKNALSWENICSFPIKRSDMTVQEMRELCVNFFRYCKTAVWICDQDVTFRRAKATNTPDKMTAGTVYGGLPYVGLGSGNIYRLLDFLDPNTGVVDMSAVIDIANTEGDTSVVSETMKIFGNQCAIGAYWGWGRVINSASYSGTPSMTQIKGFIRVGPYTYEPFNDALTGFTSTNTTTKIVQANGRQTMYESYAQLHLADGLVYYTTAGHVIMCSSEPVVVRNEDGSINDTKSYITIIDQATAWKTATNAAGDTYSYKSGVDTKMTFSQLYSGKYIPFTFKEFLGTDPVEPTECSFTHKAETITPVHLKAASVVSNYGISDAYAILKNASGETVLTSVTRATGAHKKTLSFNSCVDTAAWGEYAGKDHTVEIVMQLATGERYVIYRGKLA